MRRTALDPEFVEFIPAELDEGMLYVSMAYATTAHLCACGCGTKIVLPLSPAEWRMSFDGEAVSLLPSVGNWQLPCKSHYWIKGNKIRWAASWTKEEIAAGQRRDAADLEAYFASRQPLAPPDADSRQPDADEGGGWLRRVVRWTSRRGR